MRMIWSEWRTSYLFVIFESVLVLVSLLAANDGTPKGLRLFSREAKTRHDLLLTQTLSQLTVVGELVVGEAVLEASKPSPLLAEQALSGFIYAQASVVVCHVVVVKAKAIALLHVCVKVAGRVCEIVVDVELSWRMRRGRVGRANISGGGLAKCGSVDRGDCRVVAKLEVLTRLRCRRGGCVEALLVLEGACHANVE